MINSEILENYVKELKSQNKKIAKVVRELDSYFFNFLKMAVEYVFSLYEDKDMHFTIEPCGDFYNNTFHLQISPITYLVVCHVKRQELQHYLSKQALFEKYKNKYLSRFITDYEKPNFPTNEEIANIIHRFMGNFIELPNRSFCKYGTIRYGLENSFQVKIVVGYKYEDDTYVFTDNNKTVEIDFKKVQDNIKNKEKQTNKGFSKVCALLKSFETELLCAEKIYDVLIHKHYFVEELVYNIPNDILMEKNDTKLVANTLDYIAKINPYKLVKLNDEKLIDKARISYYKVFIKRMKLFNQVGTCVLLNIFE